MLPAVPGRVDAVRLPNTTRSVPTTAPRSPASAWTSRVTTSAPITSRHDHQW